MKILDVAKKIEWEGGVFNAIVADPTFIDDIEDPRLRRMLFEAQMLVEKFLSVESEIGDFLVDRTPNM